MLIHLVSFKYKSDAAESVRQDHRTRLQGLMVIYTLLVVAINVVTDIAYGIADPRIKLQ